MTPHDTTCTAATKPFVLPEFRSAEMAMVREFDGIARFDRAVALQSIGDAIFVRDDKLGWAGTR